jgi:uncharacterized oxidoreductase
MPNAAIRPFARAIQSILSAWGSAPPEAQRVAEHLVGADACGHPSHGVGLLPLYRENLRSGRLLPNQSPEAVRDEGPVLVFDGKRGYGQWVSHFATERAIERAREAGLALYAVRNGHHMGRIGSYGEQCLEAGMVALLFVNVVSRPLVALHESREARTGTNPICIAMPSQASRSDDFLLDFATSGIAVGKCRVAAARGESVSEGLLIDADGQPTADPGVMFRQPGGALLPLGGHKGHGLNLACELLAAALGGGISVARREQAGGAFINSLFGLVVDPRCMGALEGYAAAFSEVLDYVRASAPRTDGSSVLLPGDPERIARAESSRRGVYVDEKTWGDLGSLAREAGLPPSSLQDALFPGNAPPGGASQKASVG